MTGWDLGGENNSFSFDNVGDWVSGKVVDLVERQQTDMDTGQPAFWDNGDPKMMSVVTLQTDLRDPDNPSDDGKRTVALTGSKKADSMSRMAAVIKAVKAATGSTTLKYGGKLTVQYVGDGTPTRKGFNPPKQYQAWYEAPAMELSPEPPAAAAPPAAAPPAPSPGSQQSGGGGFPAGPPAQQPPAADSWAAPSAPPVVQTPPAAPPTAPPAAPPTAPPAAPPTAPPAAPPTASERPWAQPTQEQIAGLRQLGIDPRTVYPQWTDGAAS